MLEIEKLCVTIGKNKILNEVSLSVKPHTITALIGKNAAGKSTLLSCLTGERKYTGKICLCGNDLAMMSMRERAQLISLLPQQLPCPDITGRGLVSLGRTPYLDIGKRLTQADLAETEKAIAAVNAHSLADKKISEMSGGEKQRIFLAMTLAQNTRLIAFDEPTSFLDISHEKEFYSLLTDTVKKQKKTALVVMHDLTRAAEISDNIAILDRGKIIFHNNSREAVKCGIIESVFGVKGYAVEGITVYR